MAGYQDRPGHGNTSLVASLTALLTSFLSMTINVAGCIPWAGSMDRQLEQPPVHATSGRILRLSGKCYV